MAASYKDVSPNMGAKKSGKGKKAGIDPCFEKGSDKKVAFNDKAVGDMPNEGAPKLSGKGVVAKLV